MISNLTKLKKMMTEKPWLYEEEEHAVVKLVDEALALIQDVADGNLIASFDAETWLKEHK